MSGVIAIQYAPTKYKPTGKMVDNQTGISVIKLSGTFRDLKSFGSKLSMTAKAGNVATPNQTQLPPK
jgi:hypothetical protein